MALSLIELIDGSPDCDSPSALGYWGLIIWIVGSVYLFVGLYVLCDDFFLPVLIEIARRMKMSEDVAGATLMAAGSSAPELFTAMIGVLLYPDENPGPSTNGASAAFNMCVIIGCSIFFSGYQEFQIHGFPFLRECIFYAITIVELYLFWEVITPGIIGWGESLILVLSWCSYIVVLMYNERVIKLCTMLLQKMGLAKADEVEDDKQYHAMEMVTPEQEPPALLGGTALTPAKSYHPSHHRSTVHPEHQGRAGKAFERVMCPFHFAFSWTVPSAYVMELDQAKTSVLAASFFVVLVWLGMLNFICVDAAEKIGNCLHINEDVMGLTLLAIGSSLPDCFSSILAAKQGKGEMAVSNALGSNVFDLGICIGTSFLTSSIVKGFKGIDVKTSEGFQLFIISLFLLLVLFMVAMFCNGLVLNKRIGAGLMAGYIVFIGAFCYLLQYD